MPDNVAGESEKVATDHLNKLKLIRQKQISAGYGYVVLSGVKNILNTYIFILKCINKNVNKPHSSCYDASGY